MPTNDGTKAVLETAMHSKLERSFLSAPNDVVKMSKITSKSLDG